MKMEQQEEKKLPPQRSRMLQGTASCQSIVPALAVSQSDEGQSAVFMAGVAPRRTTVASMDEECEE